MKVLFQTYFDFGRRHNGAHAVVYSLAEELLKLGVEVTFHDYWTHDPRAFDVVHYFSSYDHTNWLRHQPDDPPLVVTPISYFAWPLKTLLEQRAKRVARVFGIARRMPVGSAKRSPFLRTSFQIPRARRATSHAHIACRGRR